MIKAINKFSTGGRGNLLAGLCLWATLLSSPEAFADTKDTIAYKLAILHTKAEHPENELLGKSYQPQASTVAEFQWILDSLKTRCINPETAIADTIVENWNLLNKAPNKQKKSLSLLETARELLNTARNTRLFGTDKVNFRMTSQHWLKNKLGVNLK